jgi:hypothetical protein
MRKGVFLPMRVDDPARVLSTSQGAPAGRHLLIGAGGSNDALFRPAALASDDAGGRTYQSLVPFDVPVELVLSSSPVQLADAVGTPLQARTTTIPVSVPRGQTPSAVRVVVTGLRAP